MVWVPQQIVPRRSDHHTQSGLRDFGNSGECPRLLASVNARHVVDPASGMRFGKPEQIRIGNGLADTALPSLRRLSDQNLPVVIGERNLELRLGVFAHKLLHQIVQVQRCQKNKFDGARVRADRIGDLQNRYAGQFPKDRLQRHAIRGDQRLSEIAPVTKIKRASGQQRIAKELAVRCDRQYARILRIGFPDIGQKG